MVYNLLKLIRIKHWIKNLFVFVPLIFSLHLFHTDYLLKTSVTFLLFCLSSSAIYIINDIVDLEADKQHPVKRNRPLASGKFTIKFAFIIAVLLVLSSLILSVLFNVELLYIIVLFILLNISYSFYLKHVVLLDIFSIAMGFAIRVYAGAYAIDVPISSWLILSTIFISLFLATMKRHSELKRFENQDDVKTRKVLESYSLDFTKQMATIAASGLVTCYALYTVAERTVNSFGTENLVYTTPFVVFGLFRFMFLEYINQRGENTTDIMLSDIPTIVNLALYFITSVLIIYKII